MYKRIVVPLDLSTLHPAAVGFAEVLADRCPATIELVTVSSPGLDHEDDQEALAKLMDYVAGDDVTSEVLDISDAGRCARDQFA